MNSNQIILHHYPQSPITEKVRVVFGMKGISWHSVLIPRVPPRPNLMALTGGYRRTPVMQIGADIYCDTACIIREIEHRFPNPPIIPDNIKGIAWGVGQWTDGPLFNDVVTVALVEMSATMPPEFLADRGLLYFGEDFSLEGIQANYAQSLAKVRAQFGWIDDNLSSNNYMLGIEPSIADVFCYYLVWFLRSRMEDGDQFLRQFKWLVAWEQLIRDIGHGTSDDMLDLEALDVARNANPLSPEYCDPDDPLGLAIGECITVEPASGGPQVAGALHSLSANHVAIIRNDENVQRDCVHFPRVGYKINRD
jgi:glutathione S-transferase